MNTYYHIYADGKTVREISEEQYFKLQRRNCLVCWLDEEGIVFVKGYSVIHIPLKQLKQILKTKSCKILESIINAQM